MTVVVSRNLRIHPSASMSVSAFWIAFDWTRDGFGVVATEKGPHADARRGEREESNKPDKKSRQRAKNFRRVPRERSEPGTRAFSPLDDPQWGANLYLFCK